jgi:hypothetical protein
LVSVNGTNSTGGNQGRHPALRKRNWINVVRIGKVCAGPQESTLELDSHADMPVLGRNCYVFERTGRSVEVIGYDPALG